MVFATGCSTSKTQDASSPSSSSSSTTPSEDLRFLATQIAERQPAPHPDRAPQDLDDPEDPDELLVAAMRMANLGIGHGHGGVYPWAQRSLVAWPLHMYAFPDGVRVVGGEGLPVGARLMGVGTAGITEVLQAVRPLVPHDNGSTIESRLPAYLAFPAVLRGLGFDPRELTWELPDGTTVTQPPPEPISSESFRELLGLFQAQVPPSLPYDYDVIFSSEQRGRVIYVRWNQVQSTNGSAHMTDFAQSIVSAVEGGTADAVVIDIRHNPGGEVDDAEPLANAVRRLEARRAGTVTFLIGRATFSAASATLADLEIDLDVRTIGETTGGNRGFFSDPVQVTLPGSGIVAFVNTSRFDAGDGREIGIEPDEPVTLSWADYSAGRDSAYEAAVGR